MDNVDISAVIPARLNSSRVEHKVFQSIKDGESLLARKINQLRRLLPKQNVIVNTESDIIADESLKHGATVHFRDPYFADGHKASFSELIKHVIQKISSDHIAWTPFVVPFFDETEFRQSFDNYEKFVLTGEFDSLVSVVKVNHYFWNDTHALNYSPTRHHTISQDLPAWYQVTNGNYMAPNKLMQDKAYLLGDRVFLDQRNPKCGIDIDTLHDLRLAKAYELVYDDKT